MTPDDWKEMPFYVSFGDQPTLYRLSDGRFQIVREGPLRDLMSGPGYFLASYGLLEILRSEAPNLAAVPVILFDPRTTAETGGFSEFCVTSRIAPESLATVASVGAEAIWQYDDQYLFVFPKLRARLAAVFPDATFTEGFSWFAGA